MLEDHKKLLYPNCKDGQKKLGSTLELLQWMAENGLSDKGFEKLLKIMKNMLPKNNKLPASTYEAKKVIYPLGLDVQKIHAYPNDCILYRGEGYENLDACSVVYIHRGSLHSLKVRMRCLFTFIEVVSRPHMILLRSPKQTTGFPRLSDTKLETRSQIILVSRWWGSP
jgi:hypothetical protein